MRFLKILVLIIFLSANACSQSNDHSFELMLDTLLSNSVETISAMELKERMNQENILLLDARQKKEYKVSHIKDAVYIGYDEFDSTRLKDISKEQEVVIYCSVGYRSERIAEKLENMGFQNIKNLRGGIFDWKNQGNDVVNEYGQKTNKVHAYNRIWGLWLDNAEKVYE